MKRNNAVTVRLTDRELNRLKDISEYLELSLSETLRVIINDTWFTLPKVDNND